MSQPKIAALQVTRIALDKISPHPKNPRVLPAPGSPEWGMLSVSMANCYFDPLVVNRLNMMLVSGHLRFAIMLAEGYTEADCSVVELSEEKHIAMMIGANRHGGQDDQSLLETLLADLAGHEDVMFLTGIGEDELAELLGPKDEDPPETEEKLADDEKHFIDLRSDPDAKKLRWPKLAHAFASDATLTLFVKRKGEKFHRKITEIELLAQASPERIVDVVFAWKKKKQP